MSNAIQIKARKETGPKSAKVLRNQGQVPGVIYGDDIPNRHFIMTENQFGRLLKEKGTSSIFDVQIEGEPGSVKAILHDWQNHPVTDRTQHIDLYQVRMDKKLRTNIALEFIGESPAVKDLAGTLTKQITELPIEALPADLIGKIEVNIGNLKTFADLIRVKDLLVPDKIKILVDANAIVAKVTEPRSEKEIAALDQEVKEDIESVEVTSEKKDEEGGEKKEGEDKTKNSAENKDK